MGRIRADRSARGITPLALTEGMGERPPGTSPSAAGRSPFSFGSLGEGASRLRSDPFASVQSAESASPFTDAGRTERGAARHEPSRRDPTPIESTVIDY